MKNFKFVTTDIILILAIVGITILYFTKGIIGTSSPTKGEAIFSVILLLVLLPIIRFIFNNPFFKERFGELHNITWPTQKQAIHSMILVLSIMLIVGLFLGFVDYGLNQAVLTLIG